MTGRTLAGSMLFFGSLIPLLMGAADDAVKVEIAQPHLALDNTATSLPYVAHFKLSSDIQFTNQSKAAIEMPDLDNLRSAVVGITFDGVESQQIDGSWRFVVPPPNLVWKIETVFADCKPLGPGETAGIKGYSHTITIFRKNVGESGSKATIRLTRELSCTQRDGNVVLKPVTTIPFVLTIPALP